MRSGNWLDEFPGAVTAAEADGRIVYLNKKASEVFEKEGGTTLVGKNLFDCHNPNSGEKIKKILASGRPNVYTIEKAGVKKLIYQAPWIENNQLRGVVELSLEIPFNLPHFVRD